MDEPGGRLFQTDSNRLPRETRAERCHPGMKRFGAAFNYTALHLVFRALLQANVDFLVRFIQANEGCVGLVLSHGSSPFSCVELICVLWATRIALVLRKPYSRGVENASANENSFVERERTGPVRSSG